MKTGFAKKCITPPVGTPISGYYEKRTVKGVLDDLYAACVSFDDGERRALIISVEICELSCKQTDKMRALISEKTGIDTAAIFINCTHTHTGPSIEFDLANLPTNPEYDAFIYDVLTDIAIASLKDMHESELSVGSGTADGISFVRRFRMKSGGVQTNPGVDNPDIAHPLGAPDNTVSYLKIERKGAESIVIVSFGTHADTVGGEFVSGDWPSVVCKTVEDVFENTKCIFLTGVQGDVGHINTSPSEIDRQGLNYDSFDGVPRGYEHTRFMGHRVAAAVIAGLDKTSPINCHALSYSQKELHIPSNKENHRLDEAKRICELHESGRDSELPYEKMELTTVVAEASRICALADGPDFYNYTIGALRLGDFVIATLPGECFVEIGRQIKQGYGKDSIFVCCLTNGGDTYFPTSSAYSEGGYEARTSQLKVGCDRILIDGMLSLLGK